MVCEMRDTMAVAVSFEKLQVFSAEIFKIYLCLSLYTSHLCLCTCVGKVFKYQEYHSHSLSETSTTII